jgi:glucosyl-3-phosphoglycerate synthase
LEQCNWKNAFSVLAGFLDGLGHRRDAYGTLEFARCIIVHASMSDFFQHGLISTLHRLVNGPIAARAHDLLPGTETVDLLLPCHYSEIGTAALEGIIDCLRDASFLSGIVISMNGIPHDQTEEVKRFWSRLNIPHVILRNDSSSLMEQLRERDLAANPGKGLNIWLALGWLAAHRSSGTILVHDCDIANYELDIVAALAIPVAGMGYNFCKGYYSRVGEELFGRVTRIFLIPLVRSLERVIGHTPLLDFIDSFRYPLAGEFSIRFETAMELPIESGWGIEIGSLCELHRHLDPGAVCQVDLAISYDHKHRNLDAGQPAEGLLHTASEVAASLLTHLEREGCRLDARTLGSVEGTYRAVSKDFVRRYQHVAILNGLPFDTFREIGIADAFSKTLSEACSEFVRGTRSRSLPPWRRILRSDWRPEFTVI